MRRFHPIHTFLCKSGGHGHEGWRGSGLEMCLGRQSASEFPPIISPRSLQDTCGERGSLWVRIVTVKKGRGSNDVNPVPPLPPISKNADSIVHRLHLENEKRESMKKDKKRRPAPFAGQDNYYESFQRFLKLSTIQYPFLLLLSLFHKVFSSKTLN